MDLKAEYKAATGESWKPGLVAAAPVKTEPQSPSGGKLDGNSLLDQIASQGLKVRDLKAKKTAKSEVDAAVKVTTQIQEALSM